MAAGADLPAAAADEISLPGIWSGVASIQGSAMRLPWPILISILLLAGCVSRQQIEKTRADFSNLRQERRARDIREQCIDSGAVPGTAAYLECRMRLEKPQPKTQP
jgi:hypothetical protein